MAKLAALLPAILPALGLGGATAGGLATAAGIGGGLLSGIGAIQQGRATSRQARGQANVLEQQAAREREIAQASEGDFRTGQSRAAATRRALFGATGGDISTGSARLVTEDISREVEQQAARIRQGGELRSSRLTQQAGLERARGRQARRAGVFRGGANLLTGIGGAFG